MEIKIHSWCHINSFKCCVNHLLEDFFVNRFLPIAKGFMTLHRTLYNNMKKITI